MNDAKLLNKRRHYIRSSVFGIEDSLVSTTGLIAGVAVAASDKKFVIIAGVIAIAVEAISMAAGEFISEDTESDLSTERIKPNSILSGFIMFVSYFLAGLIPIIPIILFPLPQSVYISITVAILSLFVLGVVKGKITRQSLIKSGLMVMIVGGVATAIGIIVGILFKI